MQRQFICVTSDAVSQLYDTVMLVFLHELSHVVEICICNHLRVGICGFGCLTRRLINCLISRVSNFVRIWFLHRLSQAGIARVDGQSAQILHRVDHCLVQILEDALVFDCDFILPRDLGWILSPGQWRTRCQETHPPRIFFLMTNTQISYCAISGSSLKSGAQCLEFRLSSWDVMEGERPGWLQNFP